MTLLDPYHFAEGETAYHPGFDGFFKVLKHGKNGVTVFQDIETGHKYDYNSCNNQHFTKIEKAQLSLF